jgi:aspartyl-tRNA(Asn)/glutamyl-tRNA(Gln) amidotransferase subunit A
VYDFYRARAEKYNREINCFVRFFSPGFLEDSQLNENCKLTGIPVAVKDNICIKGEEITCASKILSGFISFYNATVIEKILAAGIIPFASANMDEFAFGSSCETSFYGPTLNPWDKNRVPGGSSGGSAAAVAAGLAPVALGSDTGGSIRQPAAFCGVIGFKPTYGRVSRYGLIAFASSLDQIGVFCRYTEDCAYMLDIICGKDEKDSTSVDKPHSFLQHLGRPIKGMKVGLPKEYFGEGCDEGVRQAIEEAKKVFKELGAELVEISLPHTKYGVPVYYIITPSEISSNLARFDGIKYGFSASEAKI